MPGDVTTQGRLRASDATYSLFERWLELTRARRSLDEAVLGLSPDERQDFLDLIRDHENRRRGQLSP
jgi:hypothetical protein